MKNIISLFLIFCGVASFAQKAEYDVINDFLEVEFSKMNHDTIFVIEEPLKKINTLEMYKLAFSQKNVSNESSEKKVWVYPGINLWPLNEKEVSEFEKKLSDDKQKNWSNRDFEKKTFITIPEKMIKDKDFVKNHFSNNRSLRMSRPLYNKEKTLALFQFYPALLFGGSSSNNSGVILMERKDDKWIQIAVMQLAVYN